MTDEQTALSRRLVTSPGWRWMPGMAAHFPDEMTALSRRLVACKGWRWMGGMQDQRGRRAVQVWPDDLGIKWSHIPECGRVPRDADALPDLTDAATLGCLLALVRQAWGDPFLCAVGDPDTGWRIDAVTAQVQDLHGYACEAEALVSALERSP